MPEKTYGLDEIQVLTVMEAIRKRPHMYVGGGIDHKSTTLADKDVPVRLLVEVLCQSVHAARKGDVKTIGVTLLDEGKALVWDDGPSWDPTINERLSEKLGYPLSTAEMSLTMLFGCRESLWGCAEESHLHDLCKLGIVTTNALSTTLELEIRRDGQLWKQTYHKGVPEKPLEKVPFYTRSEDRNGVRQSNTGTDLYLQLDSGIVKSLDFDLDQLTAWCTEAGGPEYRLTKGDQEVVIPSTM